MREAASKIGSDLARRGRVIRRWMMKRTPLWRTLAILAVLLAALAAGPYVALPLQSADSLRVSGWLMQLFGISAVAFGLQKTRREVFGRPTLWSAFKSSMAELAPAFRRTRPQRISGSGAVSAGPAIASGRGSVWPGPSASDHERIAHLEKRVKELDKELRDSHRELENEVDNKVKDEERQRREGDDKLERKIEEATIGGIHIELSGLVLLVAGVTFGTIPDYVVYTFGL